MQVLLVEAKPGEPRSGNAVTARRWSRILESLGHDVQQVPAFEGQDADLLLALHAVRSAGSVRRWRKVRPESPVVVALTGTDLYPSLEASEEGLAAASDATRLVVLQEHGRRAVPAELRPRVRVIYQSARCPEHGAPSPAHGFRVALVCHMRQVKDPFRVAEAARLLPRDSRIRIVHVGAAVEPGYAERARREMESNSRYEWRGEVPREEALSLLAGSRLLAATSRLEGAGNVVSEALACSVPVVASDAGGLVGMLGADYPGLFPVGDTRALAALLDRAESEASFYEELEAACARRAELVRPERERDAWGALLGELRV